MELDALAARVARRQLGLITHRQALDIGFTPGAIQIRLDRRRWQLIRKGVYVVGGVPPSWEQSLLAVTLPFEDCWISHGTGARHWNLPFAPQLDAIEALRPYGKHRRIEGVLEHRSRLITPADITRHKRIPVTSLARTIVDCSGRLTVAQTGKLIDEARRRDLRHLEETRAAFARVASGGRRRLRSIRAALAMRLPGYDPGESDLELRALKALTRGGLPVPVQQLRIVLNGKRRRIDLAYPQWMIAIELQSWEWHSGRAAFDDDHAKANELVAIGYRLLAFTSETSDDDMVRLVLATRSIAA